MSHVDVTGWVSIGEECLLGSHATVLPHVVVGARSIIGAGSAVIRKVNEESTVIGVPAKAIRG
jgi:acetyltransferase-like isoleucine patch superfamily enzyme